jgi:hypothetical protein
LIDLSTPGPGRFGAWGPFLIEVFLTTPQHPVCPHCGTKLQAFELPDASNYEGDFHLACFSDECPYYIRGWAHMETNYAVKSSYRYRVDPTTGKDSPLAVWSKDAIKDRIIEASIGTSEDPKSENNGGCS